jgi:hypothetical protein
MLTDGGVRPVPPPQRLQLLALILIKSISQDLCRVAGHHGVVSDIAKHDGPGSYHSAITNRDTRREYRTVPNPDIVTYLDIAATKGRTVASSTWKLKLDAYRRSCNPLSVMLTSKKKRNPQRYRTKVANLKPCTIVKNVYIRKDITMASDRRSPLSKQSPDAPRGLYLGTRIRSRASKCSPYFSQARTDDICNGQIFGHGSPSGSAASRLAASIATIT